MTAAYMSTLGAQITAVRANRSRTERWTSPATIWVDRYEYSQCWDMALFEADIAKVIRDHAGQDIQVTS